MKVSVAGKTLADFPELIKQIDREKHPSLEPEKIKAGSSSKKLNWICTKGPDHKWKSDVCGRATRSGGCPFCSGRALSITNCLETRYPEVAKQWHPTRNEDKTPKDFTYSSGKKVWWLCPDCGDDWKAQISNRTLGNSKRCRDCGHKITAEKRSIPEAGNSLLEMCPQVANEWHPTKNGDLEPSMVFPRSGKLAWWVCGDCKHRWNSVIAQRTEFYLKASLDSPKRGRGCPKCAVKIRAQKLLTPKPGMSLGDLHPKLLEELHPTKNSGFDPFSVNPGATRKIWWKCKVCLHEWKVRILERARSGYGCKKCGYKKTGKALSKPKPGESLAELFPEIAAQWHPTKNGSITPSQLRSGSNRKCWWKCDKGPDHVWDSVVFSRTGEGHGCPYCSSNKVSITNSLETNNPELTKLWHPTLNGKLTPKKVTEKSRMQVWWKCPEGPDHEWKSSPGTIVGNAQRRKTGNGCPCCSNHQLSVTNCLQTVNPELALEWMTEKNGKRPEEVMAGGHKKYWWKCDKGPDHKWEASMAKRVGMDRGCPFCAGQKVSVTNSLAITNAKAAKLWYYEKNGKITPEDIVPGSNRKYWWKCPEGPDHEWKASPHNIVTYTKNSEGCPFCVGRRVSVTNSLATRYPEIAELWHPVKNSTTPDRITYGSYVKRWWKCPEGPDHEWRTTPSTIVQNRKKSERSGCPCCRGLQVSVTNSLANLLPEIAKEWHPTKNKNLTPEKVVAGTDRKVWWQCLTNKEHTWYVSPKARHQYDDYYSGCPECHILPRSQTEIYLAFEIQKYVDFDMEKHKIKTIGKLLDVDIVIESLKLCIEFDGSMWHKEKAEKDKAKTDLLKKNGWKVIRIREKPLEIIDETDIQVPIQRVGKCKAMANKVLKQIEEVCDITIDGLDEYLGLRDPVNAKAAKAYITKLFKDKEQTTLDV